MAVICRLSSSICRKIADNESRSFFIFFNTSTSWTKFCWTFVFFSDNSIPSCVFCCKSNFKSVICGKEAHQQSNQLLIVFPENQNVLWKKQTIENDNSKCFKIIHFCQEGNHIKDNAKIMHRNKTLENCDAVNKKYIYFL